MQHHRDIVLIAACLVLGLAALSSVHDHVPFSAAGWASPCRQTISAAYVVHMAELQMRRLLSTVGEVFSIG